MWKNHFFTANFTDVSALLVDLPVKIPLTEAQELSLVGLFKTHDPRPSTRDNWHVGHHDLPLNLKGAVVLYNGPNNRQYRTNAKYSHVVVVLLPWATVDRNDDVVYLQYNLDGA